MASESLQVRRRPTGARLGDSQRNSNVVRASVLETALELGFGQNSTVADWIFNNPVSEEPEDLRPEPVDDTKSEIHSEPPLDVMELQDVILTFTSGSNSMSDESSSLNSPANNVPSAAIATIQVHTHTPSLTESPHVHFSDFPSDQLQLFSPFVLSPHGTLHTQNKAPPAGRLHKDMERPRSQDDGLRCDPIHESPEPAYGDSGYTSEGQYLSKVKASKEKDKSKGKKGLRPKTPDKSGEKDGDYASDGGYLSASSNKSLGKASGKVKSRAIAFFRRRPKRSASDDDDEAGIPPVPALPTLPRPSSPKPLERRTAPSSPIRSGFSPFSLNLPNPPVSHPRRRVSKSPPPAHTRTMPPQRPDHLSAPQRPASPLATPVSAPVLPTPATTVPLPLSVPSTPLSTASFPLTSVSSTRHAPGTGSISRPLTASSSRQHLTIPPPAPPPTFPLPQPPLSPPASTNGPATLTTQSRRGSPARLIPVAPTTPGSTQPLTPRRTASPFRPILSPRSASEGSQLNGKGVTAKRPGAALSGGLGSTPAFLQRKIQHGPPPSPRRPPPDVPPPPSPFLAANTRPRTPISSSSKFHEHLSSVSSVPLSEVLSAPMSKSPSPSTATLSGSSSGPSVRSSHISSVSERNDGLAIRDPSNKPDFFRPKTSASSVSESSYGQPVSSTFSRPAIDFRSRISDRSDNSSSVYSPPMHRDSSSITTCDVDDADVDDFTPKSFVDVEDDDGSLYPSDDKTAGRRTMYLLEHGELDESGDEIVVNGSRYWNNAEVSPPAPPLPPMPTRPGPGYF